MGEVFLDNTKDKFVFIKENWRLDLTYRKAFNHRMYANVDNAPIKKTYSKIIYVFKNNTKILINEQARSMKFKNSDLVRIDNRPNDYQTWFTKDSINQATL